MLDFPSTPSVGDTLTGPSGQEWEWDGVKWIAVGGGGGGGGVPTDVTGTGTTFVLQQGPTINQPRIMGVTNGSNAQAGEVGEYISRDVMMDLWQMDTVSNNVNNTSPFSMSLPPGDWDVFLNFFGEDGVAFFGTNSNVTAWGVSLMNGGLYLATASWANISGTISSFSAFLYARSSSTSPVNVSILFRTTGSAGSGIQPQGTLSARRVR